MKNMLIAQSGGPTAAINASLSGAVKRAMKHPEIGEIYGARNGLEGLLEERFVDFRALLREEADFERLKRTPAMLLGSCRLRLSPEPDETYEKILGIFRQYRIGYFFYIGGNDSMDTVWKLSRFLQARGEQISVVGIPKTIDNDLACTDHTPGGLGQRPAMWPLLWRRSPATARFTPPPPSPLWRSWGETPGGSPLPLC